jgi:epoxyqueuosine reductase QueG
MENLLRNEIRRFVREEPGNRFPGSDQPYFDQPLIGIVAADDPLFQQYKQIIGPFHRTPQEILPTAATVISWVMPITRITRESNRKQTTHPSLQWAQTRSFGDEFIMELRRHLVSWLQQQGHHAVAPLLEPNYQRFVDTPVGLASTWSERHVAYAAGLGTFSLNDALITQRGIAHRLGSVVTDLALEPTVVERLHYQHNCLYYRNNSCKVCISRCPADAISTSGHDKKRCDAYLYTSLTLELAGPYGTPIPGCGLCQTKVPCEQQIPG